MPRSEWLILTAGEHAGKTICQLCHRQRINEGDPDPCLGKLPGVKNACCGHGLGPGYVVFENGVQLVFDLSCAKRWSGPRMEKLVPDRPEAVNLR